MTHVLRFDSKGRIDCLYTEAIDLGSLGRLEIRRATDIRFKTGSQQWEVHDDQTDETLFADPSRDACLRWENANLQPG